MDTHPTYTESIDLNMFESYNPEVCEMLDSDNCLFHSNEGF